MCQWRSHAERIKIPTRLWFLCKLCCPTVPTTAIFNYNFICSQASGLECVRALLAPQNWQTTVGRPSKRGRKRKRKPKPRPGQNCCILSGAQTHGAALCSMWCSVLGELTTDHGRSHTQPSQGHVLLAWLTHKVCSHRQTAKHAAFRNTILRKSTLSSHWKNRTAT